MKIYTRTGDRGTTGLLGSGRVRKDAPRLSLIGTLDETNAAIGASAALLGKGDLRKSLVRVQADLFGLGHGCASIHQRQRELFEIPQLIEPADDDLAEEALVVAERLVADDPRKRFVAQDGTDVLMLEFDGAFASGIQPWKERAAVRCLVDRGTSELRFQHREVIADDCLDLFARPVNGHQRPTLGRGASRTPGSRSTFRHEQHCNELERKRDDVTRGGHWS